MKTIITVPTIDLLACATIAPTKDSRPELNGVYLDKNCMVATDGHRLISIPYSAETVGSQNEFAPIIVPTSAVAALRKLITARERNDSETSILVEDTPTTSQYHLSCGVYLGYFTPVNMPYPPYDRVIPKEIANPSMEGITFNWEYMANFSKIAGMYGDKCKVVVLTPNGRGSALASMPIRPDITLVVMPWRV